MKTVNIGELRDQLSRYLRMVRSGEVILVRDRDRIVARLEGVRGGEAAAAESAEARLARLELKGIVRRGQGRITPELLARRPRIEADVVQAVLREREESR